MKKSSHKKQLYKKRTSRKKASRRKMSAKKYASKNKSFPRANRYYVKGAGNQKPQNVAQRRKMAGKCYLIPSEMKYPICRKNTCDVDCKMIQAAVQRAKINKGRKTLSANERRKHSQALNKAYANRIKNRCKVNSNCKELRLANKGATNNKTLKLSKEMAQALNCEWAKAYSK